MARSGASSEGDSFTDRPRKHRQRAQVCTSPDQKFCLGPPELQGVSQSKRLKTHNCPLPGFKRVRAPLELPPFSIHFRRESSTTARTQTTH